MELKRHLFISLLVACVISSCSSQVKKSSTQKPKAPIERKAKISNLTTNDFRQKVMDYEAHPEEWVFMGKRPAVIDFYATWCRPCKMMSPIMEELAQKYSNKIDFYKVDIDQEPELASVFGIQSIPTFLFVPMKGNPSLEMGMMEKGEIETRMKNILHLN